jgi:hypothetical protein
MVFLLRAPLIDRMEIVVVPNRPETQVITLVATTQYLWAANQAKPGSAWRKLLGPLSQRIVA